MTEPADHDSSAAEDTGVGPARDSITGPPRWVKVSGIIAIVLVLLFVIHLLTGFPGMSVMPGTHAPPTGGQTLS